MIKSTAHGYILNRLKEMYKHDVIYSKYSIIIALLYSKAFGLPWEIKAEKEENRKAMSKYFPQGKKKFAQEHW